jgi:hypothetical protein
MWLCCPLSLAAGHSLDTGLLGTLCSLLWPLHHVQPTLSVADLSFQCNRYILLSFILPTSNQTTPQKC